MNQKQIEKWYRDNDIEYIERDWGPRLDTGESGETERATNMWGYWNAGYRERLLEYTAGNAEGWDPYPAVWVPLTPEEQVVAQEMEEFLEPFIERLSPEKQELLYTYFGDRQTFENIAEEEGVTRQAVWSRVQTVLNELTAAIAAQNPEYAGPTDSSS